ncbi:MAG: hypothetical protein MZV63_27100 [Marinilabiliales bacterium]|nr:hypothetical protein [Marinilabiliales bacterium]
MCLALQLVGLAGVRVQPAHLQRVALVHEADVLPLVLAGARGADAPQRHGAIAALQPDRRRVGLEEVRHDLVGGVVLAGIGDRLRRQQPPDRLQLRRAQPVLRVDAALHRVDGPGGGDPGLRPFAFQQSLRPLTQPALFLAKPGRELALGLCRRRLVDPVELAVERRERRVAADQRLDLALRFRAVEGRASARATAGEAGQCRR